MTDEQGSQSEPQIRDAASVILVRRSPQGPRVLMGLRGAKAVFMPSQYVFPGGAVDPSDRTFRLAASIGQPCLDRLRQEPRQGANIDADALAAAALRELVEETGLLIGRGTGTERRSPASDMVGYAEAGLIPDASSLHFVFRAITPTGRPRRFDARFFIADAASLSNDPDDFSAACDELSHLHWVPLDEARGLDLPFITEVVLAEVAELVTAAGQGPLAAPDTVPFYDNRGPAPRFCQIA